MEEYFAKKIMTTLFDNLHYTFRKLTYQQCTMAQSDSSAFWANTFSFIALVVSVGTFVWTFKQNKEKEKVHIAFHLEPDINSKIDIVKSEMLWLPKVHGMWSRRSKASWDSTNHYVAFPVNVTLINKSTLPQYLQRIAASVSPRENILLPQKMESMGAVDFKLQFLFPLRDSLYKKVISMFKISESNCDSFSIGNIEGKDSNSVLTAIFESFENCNIEILFRFYSPSSNDVVVDAKVLFHIPNTGIPSYSKEREVNYIFHQE